MSFDYKDLIENSIDFIWEVDIEGKYTYVNSSVTNILGYSKDEVIGKTPFDFMPEYEKNRVSILFMNIFAAKKSFKNLENINLHKDGYEVILETSGAVILNDTGDVIGYRGIDRDITDNKKIKEELELVNKKLNKTVKLRTNELEKVIERYDLANSGSSDGLWDWNLLTDEVYYSPKWKRMLGYEESELENTLSTWVKLVHIEEKDNILKKVEDYIGGKKEEFETEMKMYHKNGSTINVLSRAFLVRSELTKKPIRLVGTHIDITYRKKSEEFIKKTNSILEMVAMGNLASDVYIQIALMYEARHQGLRCSLLELEDGVLLHGGAPSMPKAYTDAVHGLKNGPEVGSCGTSTYTGHRVIVENIETDPKWKDIKQFALPHGMRCCWSEPIISSSGKVLGAFGMYYNHFAVPNEEESKDLSSAARLTSIVMERDQLKKLLDKNQKIISEQNKLASMGEMIGNIAHQWRQPLSVISAASTGLKLKKEMNTLTDKEFIYNMESINESAQYLSQTIEDFRSFLDPRNSKLKEFQVSKTIEKAITIISSQFTSNKIELIKDIENTLIVSLENELIQVLINLLNNSKDALLNIENIKRLIFMNIYTEQNRLYIEVKDSGGGIETDLISRIFEPYFTTKHKSKGTGIGLYMSRNIVNTLLNGTLSAENDTFIYEGIKYTGAKFTIEIDI